MSPHLSRPQWTLGFIARFGLVTWGALVPIIGPVVSLAREPAAESCPWLVPVDAVVVDPYREPSHPYGPGNRGIEYGVEPGDEVRAVAPGRIGFVGVVAGDRYLVVEHSGSVRSTYGPIGPPRVVRGQQVEAGEDLAPARPGLHLTARLGDDYVDPQPLIDGRCGRPRLVPLP